MSTGLPVEGVGILMAVDLIPDTFRTILNLTGDMAAAAVLSRQHRAGGATQLATIYQG